MNNVDKQYLNLLKDIIDNGYDKNTRAGKVKSVFGRMLSFNLKEGFPLLTTKKVFTKGIIHELLWFLMGDTNIKYLVNNNVHIWDDDAYRYYLQLIDEHNDICELYGSKSPTYASLTKEEFITNVIKQNQIIIFKKTSGLYTCINYTFGDLGDVYGKSWRNFGIKNVDQIQNIVNTLRNNPDDRRMLCIAYNPDVLEDVALPPCHVMFQFYTRELNIYERYSLLNKKDEIYEPLRTPSWEFDFKKMESEMIQECDEENIPTRELSCMWTQRSVDSALGLPYNIASYALLTYMIAHITNMTVGELKCSLGDCHIYLNQMDGILEQINRDGFEILPSLEFKSDKDIKEIDDFDYDSIIISNYNSDPPIKFPLSVGL
jgi:thymidylate synthase